MVEVMFCFVNLKRFKLNEYVLDRMFNQQEVQILLGGVNSPIDIEDLKMCTNYGGLYDSGHLTIRMFWKVSQKKKKSLKRSLIHHSGRSSVHLRKNRNELCFDL